MKISFDKKGLAYEKDFYGNEGGFTRDYFLVAYKKGETCPRCNAIIEKIKPEAHLIIFVQNARNYKVIKE